MESEVVERARRGDQDAFRLLVVELGDPLFGVARRILRDVELAEDAVQLALLALWRDLPELRDASRLEAWSYRLLVRICLRLARRQRRERVGLRFLPAVGIGALDPLGQVDDRDELERAFARLSTEHRAVVVLRYWLDLSPEAIGEALGIPAGTVRSRIHYAMDGLRAAMDAEARPVVKRALP